MKLEDLTNAPLPRLAQRRPDSHKGDFGRAVLIGGSRGMSGAIALAGKAALRGGAGLVTLAVPRAVQDVVAAIEPSYMTRGLADGDGQFAKTATSDAINLGLEATAVAIGPGLGRSDTLVEFVDAVNQAINKPMVVDADALFALSKRPEALSQSGGPRVLTPHAGEFSRLTGQTLKDETRIEAAAQFAGGQNELIVVLKGHHTVVTDGRRYSINQTGNPGMATGGTGDVLTGIITALLCQGLEPFEAARLGVHVHGVAGDLAAEELGQVSLIASDLVDYIPFAFESLNE